MFSLILRTLILYIVVIVSIRLMGKRQVGDMQPGELVVTILISEIAAIPIQDADVPVLYGVSSIALLISAEIIVSFLALKNMKFRKMINGGSAIIIKDGIIDQNKMKQLRLTMPDLMELLRLQNVFDISEVGYAILETNGNLSVVLKPENRPVTAKQLKVEKEKSVIPTLIVCDGRIIDEGLRLIGKTRNFIDKTAQREKMKIQDIFMLVADKNGEYIITKKDRK